MLRKAQYTFKISEPPPKLTLTNKRTAEERIAIDKDKLYITLDALHWEQRKVATPKEKALYGVAEAYGGNDNGDFFEGGRNVVWACKNPECTNTHDRLASKGTRRFLKYEENDCCPHCGSKDIYDWEYETFQTRGELLSKTQDGRFRYETWKGEPVNVNHDDKREVGDIEDVWPEPHRKAIVELISIRRNGPHNNDQLCRKIEAQQIDSGSMELLTGIGMCSVCFNVHHSEEDFCDHLKNEKGLINQRTGMHVFEICKSIQGCGHAIIATGDPADSGALVRQVLASKNISSPVEPSTNLNQGMANTLEGKPDFSDKKAAVARKPNLDRIGRSAQAGTSSISGEKPLPTMDDMGAQLKAFGNYDSARSAEDIRLASMSPEERAEYEEFKAFKAAKANKKSASISSKPTLRVDQSFLKAAIRTAVSTKKLSSRGVFASLGRLTLDKDAFINSLTSRKLSSNAVSRLALRKAELINPDELEETLMDVIADALIDAGERMKQQISDVTYDDTFDASSEIADSPEEDFVSELDVPAEEDPKNDIPLDKSEPVEEEPRSVDTEEEKEPTVIHDEDEKEDKSQENEDDEKEPESSDSLEEDKMKKDAQKTEKFPEAKPYTPPKSTADRTIGTEGEPTVDKKSNPKSKVSTTLKIALQRRAQALEQSIEKGEGDIDTLVTDYTKVTAQLAKLDDLGGNGMDENPDSVDHVSSQKSLSAEDGPKSPDKLGGNGIDENPKPVAHKATKKEVREALARVEASISNPSAVSSKDISFLKDCGILPKDYKAGQALPKATSLDTEEFPESAEDAGGELKTAEFSKADQKMIEQENAHADTKPGSGLKDEESNKGWTEKTKPGAALDDVEKDKGWTNPTGLKENDAEMAKQTGQVEGSEVSTKTKSDESKQEKDLGWNEKTKPGAAIKDEAKNKGWERTAQLTAEYSEPSTPGSVSDANWTVFADSEPILRVALRHAYPGEIVKRKAQFASEEYASTLIEAIQTQGVDAVHTDTFGGTTKLFTPEERSAMRKAQAAPVPAATNVPQGADANVDPAVADKILNDAKPGISVLDLISNLIAPVIAESDTLSVASFMEDLVAIGQNQDKVTELTTKLNANVQTIKSNSGLPTDTNEIPGEAAPSPTEGAPGPVSPPPAASPNPQVVQAMKSVSEAERRWALKLQASRIEPVVQEEQTCGLIPGATQFHAEGYSRRESSRKAREVFQSRVAELMQLPEEAYLIVEREIRTACKRVREQRQESKSPRLAERRERFEQMKREAGAGDIVSGIAGDITEASSNIKEGSKLSLSFKSAGGITKEGLTKAMELRDSRSARKD